MLVLISFGPFSWPWNLHVFLDKHVRQHPSSNGHQVQSLEKAKEYRDIVEVDDEAQDLETFPSDSRQMRPKQRRASEERESEITKKALEIIEKICCS